LRGLSLGEQKEEKEEEKSGHKQDENIVSASDTQGGHN